MKKIAVMQPYFCPHIGYFQLVDVVDTFIFYDDVQYIKGGYINRNVLKNNYKFTIPVSKKDVQSMKNINEVHINWDNKFLDKFGKTIRHTYSKSPNRKEILDLLNSMFDKRPRTISELAMNSIKTFSDYLGLKTQFLKSSELEYDKTDDRAINLINICKSQSSDHYVNSIGGRKLYDKNFFSNHGINLNFIDSLSGLSIIDLCMDSSLQTLRKEIKQYQLI